MNKASFDSYWLSYNYFCFITLTYLHSIRLCGKYYSYWGYKFQYRFWIIFFYFYFCIVIYSFSFNIFPEHLFKYSFHAHFFKYFSSFYIVTQRRKSYYTTTFFIIFFYFRNLYIYFSLCVCFAAMNNMEKKKIQFKHLSDRMWCWYKYIPFSLLYYFSFKKVVFFSCPFYFMIWLCACFIFWFIIIHIIFNFLFFLRWIK